MADSEQSTNIMTLAGRFFPPVLAFAILVLGYSFYDPNNLNVIGIALIFKHALDVLSVGLFIWMSAGVGRLCLFYSKMLPDEPIDALLFSIAVGFAIIAYLMLLLGMTATFHTAALFGLFVFLLGIAGHQGRYISSLIQDTLRIFAPPAGNYLLPLFCLIMFFLGAIFLLIFAMAPPVNWDSLMYHLHLPQNFLKYNRIFLPADNLHVAFIGLAHMLYIPFLEIGSISGPALLSVSIALMLGLSVFAAADRLFNRNAAYLSLPMLWATPTILLVAITPRVDVTLCFYLLLGQYAILTALYSNSTANHKYVYLSAVFLGLSFGVKYGGLIYAVCLSPLVGYVVFKNKGSLLNASKKILIFVSIVVVLMLPWLIKNWMLFEAPLYPFFGESAKYSPHAPPWIQTHSGTKPVAAEASVEKFVKNKSAREPLNLYDIFLNPGKITIEAEGRFYYSNLLFVLLPLGVLSVNRKRLAWLAMPAVLFIAIIYMHFPRTNLRYLLPAIAPLTIAAGYIVHRICQRLKPPKLATVVSLLLIIVSLALTARMAGHFFNRTKAFKHALGMASVLKYMQKYKIGSVHGFLLMQDYINQNLPADSVVLMLFESRSFYFRPQTIQDIRHSSWPVLLNGLTGDKCLQRAGVTHVLLNHGVLEYFTKRGSKFSQTDLEALQRFTDRCLAFVYETRSHRLYKVKNE